MLTSVPPSESKMYTTSTLLFLSANAAVLAAINDFPEPDYPKKVVMRPHGTPLCMSPVSTRFNAYDPVSKKSWTSAYVDSAIDSAPVLLRMLFNVSANFIISLLSFL